ncbi:hypothetical protein AHAS_Ahas18G0262800 [Arachis hypogaea]
MDELLAALGDKRSRGTTMKLAPATASKVAAATAWPKANARQCRAGRPRCGRKTTIQAPAAEAWTSSPLLLVTRFATQTWLTWPRSWRLNDDVSTVGEHCIKTASF